MSALEWWERHSSQIDRDLKVPWALCWSPFPQAGAITLFTTSTDTALTLEGFYELREAVNDLYDHIRQETPTD